MSNAGALAEAHLKRMSPFSEITPGFNESKGPTVREVY